MPINLPPLTPQLIKGLEQGRSEQLAALAKVLNVAIGNQVSASVEKIEPIAPAQREALLKQTQEALQQLLRSPATPAIKAQIGRLQEQQQLLSSEQLKWAHLQINGRPLLTYTDRPLLPGQTHTVQLTDAQRLALIELPPAPSAAVTTPVSTSTTSITPTGTALANALAQVLVASAQTGTSATGGVPTTPSVFTPATHSSGVGQTPAPVKDSAVDTPSARISPSVARGNPETLNILASALRTLLPQKDQAQQLYPALSPLQQLPMERRQALLPSSVQQALKTLADQLRSPQQLSNPKLLPMIMKNSGVFFESKLANQIATQGATAKSGSLQPLDNTFTNRLTSQDLKGALLQLLHRVNQELPAGSTRSQPVVPASSSPSSQSAQITSAPTPADLTQLQLSLPTSLPRLLQLLQFPQRPERELSDKVLRNQLLMLLHQQTLTSLAKIQLQQVQTLSHQQSSTDPTQPTQSWMLDIPIRHGQDVHNLELKLQQDWVDEDGGGPEGSAEKIRQWSVTLSFNLPDAGGFYAQLVVIKDTVSVKLWAEHQPTLSEARLKLDNLRDQLSAQGIAVKELHCVHGKPPNAKISLHYSLVDITT
jgi:hypothetical protein